MEKGTHGINEKTFEELSYSDQARSLNAQILVIEKAIKAHIRKGDSEGKDTSVAKTKYKDQLTKITIDLK